MASAEVTVSATNRPHLVALDSVRGLAALSVVLFHFTETGHFILSLFLNAYLMVDLFFVLSGFAIYYAYHDRIRSAAEARRFVWLRFWRLYPLHFVTLLYFLAIELVKLRAPVQLHHAAFSENSVPALLQNLFLLHGFRGANAPTFNYPSWSISIEFWIYLLFAAMTLLVRSRRPALVLYGALAIAGLALMIFVPGMRSLGANNGLPRGMAGFFAGVLTCAAYLRMQNRPRPAALGWAAMGVAILAAAFIFSGPPNADLMIVPVSMLTILLLALAPADGPTRLLATRPLRWLGARSYSLYMVHPPVGFVFGIALPRLFGRPYSGLVEGASDAAYLAAVIVVANFSFRWIETPFRIWSRKS